MLSSLVGLKAILAAIALVTVASTVGIAAGPSIGHALVSSTSGNMTAAEQAAVSYVNSHYAGNGTAKILKVENDTEHGVAVYDIKVLAPNGSVYVVQVSQSANQVISAHLAENQNITQSSDGNSNSGDDHSNNTKEDGSSSQTDN
jgi:hypothetical protein